MASRTVTRLLEAWQQGDEAALEQLTALLYRELCRLAAGYLRRRGGGHTLEPGALVHEAFLKLVDQKRVVWQGRSHFLGIAALLMRRILLDHARARLRALHGRDSTRLSARTLDLLPQPFEPDVVTLHEALQELAQRYPEAARVVELRFYGGLGEAETGALLGLSLPTVKRRWRLARAWLYRYLSRLEAPLALAHDA
ncbi:MAG: ECF-type sigma factor [Thermoanaerobaculia bacterium]